MIPAGPERDKVIGIDRGDKPSDIWNCSCGGVMFNVQQVDWHRKFCRKGKLKPKSKFKPYSTSIVHAMELWEEMKANIKDSSIGLLSLKIATTSILIVCEMFESHINNPSVLARHQAETEADAISGAWLKWKEAKK